MYTTLLDKIARNLDRHKIPYMVIEGHTPLEERFLALTQGRDARP